MKKYWLIGLYALALTSCDSFLNCEPENNFSSEGFLESESDLRLYTNGFLQSFLPSEETIAWGGRPVCRLLCDPFVHYFFDR